ncbi:MAG: hypothetical protein JXQ29_11935, partial [Planctomycetes bacterium]|nr:hypothetical protein [Planctomycetota bacterium]
MRKRAARTGPSATEVFVSLLVYAALTALLFPGVVFGDRTVASAPHIPFTLPDGPYRLATDRQTATIPLIDPWGPGQINEAHFPYRDRALRAGELPLWQPHEACGNPYFAALLPSLLHPPSYLVHLLAPTRGFDLAYLGRLALAGWLLFLFLRVHGLHRAGAFLGGAAFLGSGFLVVSLNTSNTDVVTMAPGLLLALECVARRGRRGPVLLAALMVFLVLVSGNPQSSVLALAVGGAYFLARVVTGPRGDRRARLARGAFAGLAGLLLAAPQLLPFLEFVRHGAHLEHAGFARHHASWLALPAWLVPEFYRDALAGVAARRTLFYHAGALPVVLGVAGLALPGRRFLKLFAAGALLLLGLWHFGAPGIRLLGELPVLSQIQAAKYPAAHLCLMIAVLAGVGFDRLLAAAPHRRCGTALIGGVLVAAAVPLGFWVAWWAGGLERFASDTLRLAPADGAGPQLGVFPVLIGGLLALGGTLLVRPAWRRAVIALVFLAVPAELAAHIPHAHYPRGGDPYQRPPFLTAISGDPRTFRVFSPDGVLLPNTAGVFGLNDIRYVEALKSARYARLVGKAFGYPAAEDYFPHSVTDRIAVPPRTLAMFAVRYVLSCGDVVPLPVGRLAATMRTEIAVALREGGGRLRGELRAADRGRAAVRLVLMDPAAHRVLASGRIESAQGGEVRLAGAPPRLEPGERACLVVPGPVGGRVVLEALAWGGRALALSDLSASVQGGAGRYCADTDTLEIGALPAILYLPPLEADRPAEVVLHGRGGEEVAMRVALVGVAGQPLAEITVDGGSHEAATLDVDLGALEGSDRVIGIESVGPGAAVLDRLRLDPTALALLGGFEGVRV